MISAQSFARLANAKACRYVKSPTRPRFRWRRSKPSNATTSRVFPAGFSAARLCGLYAAEVGLDPETTIQEFIAQFPHDSITAGHSTSEQVEDFEALQSDRRMASNVLWILAVSIPLAGAVIYFSMANRRAASAIVAQSPPASATVDSKAEAPAEPPPAAAQTPSEVVAPVPPAIADADAGVEGESASRERTGRSDIRDRSGSDTACRCSIAGGCNVWRHADDRPLCAASGLGIRDG